MRVLSPIAMKKTLLAIGASVVAFSLIAFILVERGNTSTKMQAASTEVSTSSIDIDNATTTTGIITMARLQSLYVESNGNDKKAEIEFRQQQGAGRRLVNCPLGKYGVF